MSRIGKSPVEIPQGVEVRFAEGRLSVKGPKGELSREIHPAVTVTVEEGRLVVKRKSDDRISRSLHGLTRSLAQNMVRGVSNGFSKLLEINGVGYRATAEGRTVTFQLGYSHPVVFTPPEGVEVEVREQGRLVVSGCDKELVGQTAANIRSFRPPEPYKGKGIMYVGERIRRKAGKTAG